MDFALSEEQELFRKSVRDFVEKEVRPAARDIDEHGEFPLALFRRCGALGFFGLRYPEPAGGLGADFTTFCLMVEEIARGSLALAAAVSMQCLMGTDFVYRFGTDEHKTRLLAPALRGEKLGTIAMTEPDFGSDLGGITTRAVRDARLVLTAQDVDHVGNGGRLFHGGCQDES
jgi:alkylation response protein AidB-like acyl-CoA dehydrogenase